MTDVFRRKTCRLCESSRIEQALALTPTPIADAYLPASRRHEVQAVYPLDLFLCLECGHLQLVDVVDPKLLFENYLYVTNSSLGLVEHFRKLAENVIAQFKPVKNALVVEMGSNDGAYLRAFKEKGLRVLGVDPAKEVALKATESGIETIANFFTSSLAKTIRQSHGEAALFVANNVFAHSDQLPDMLDGVRDLLTQDGVFIFEVAYLLDLVERKLFDTVYHEHLSYHSVKPLQAFMARHGMELVDVQRNASKGGTIRCTAQRKGGPRNVSSSITELLALENRAKIHEVNTYKTLANDIDIMKTHVQKLLTELKASGVSMAGYGASPSVTTFLYQFGLAPFVDYLVDDNPLKQNTFSPGLHLPVLSRDVLSQRKPDYIVVLAWAYAEPIIRNNEAFLNQGGQFIVPFPTVRNVAKTVNA